MYLDPQPIRVILYGQSITDPTGIFKLSCISWSFSNLCIVMLLDYGTPLSSIISTFQAVFKLAEDFAFIRYSLEDSTSMC